MKISNYEYSGSFWKIHKVNFQKVNLIVGDSGTGKTRLLNTIFNIGRYVAQNKLEGKGGDEWKLSLEIDKNNYLWEVSTAAENNQIIVKSEILYLNGVVILEKEGADVVFDQKPSPKLPKNQMAISMLREEELIKPLYDGFARIMRRKFFSDELDQNSRIYAVNQKMLDRIGAKKDLYELYVAELGLNPRLYILSKFFPDIYQKIMSYYKDSFQFISEIAILDNANDLDLLNIPGTAPIFCIKEAKVKKWVRLDELSSGMQKALLMLTDLFTMPDGTIYLIDEYENSLGIGAINLLPNLLISEDFNIQIFITSHHPYIISKFPVENWYVAHRTGTEVRFTYGEDLVKKYSASSQEKYIQLLNDPLYSEGIE